jgi:GH35 family endo-1,4-beta-xylanase
MGDSMYVHTVIDNYSQVIPGNEGKYWWVYLYGWDAMDAIVSFSDANNINVNYHCLLWAYPEIQPTDVRAWITEAMTRYPTITDWQIVNEGWGASGESIANIDEAYAIARQVRPDAVLWYNGILTSLYEQAQAMLLIESGLADGIGIQMHHSTVTNLDVYTSFLTWMRDNDVRWQVTEADVEIGDLSDSALAAQADMYAKMIQLVRDYNGEMFGTWGFVDYASWHYWNYPLPWNSDFTPKPAWFVLTVSEEYGYK